MWGNRTLSAPFLLLSLTRLLLVRGQSCVVDDAIADDLEEVEVAEGLQEGEVVWAAENTDFYTGRCEKISAWKFISFFWSFSYSRRP